MMSSFGENLRREREMRGVTLEEISAATKISVRFLQCVENEDFGKLPGGIFVRSFIRSYARYLGLDEDALLAEFQLLTKDKTSSDLSRLVASRPLPSRPKRSAWKAVVLTAAVAALLIAGFALWRRSRQWTGLPTGANAVARQPQRQNPAASRPQATVSPSGSPVMTEAPPKAASGTSGPAQGTGGSPTAAAAASHSAAPAQSEGSVPSSGGLALQIAATERSWVAVDADGKTVLQGVLEPGQVKTVQAQNSFDVVTGNAQGIVLTLNGQTLQPLGREGEVKSVHLTRDDLKNAGP